VSKLRDALVENNEKINWIPDHVKKGRFGNWLAEIKDWGISRNRYWGTPLPIWRSESGNVKFIGSFKELEELSGVNIEDPHRPYVDDITFEQDGEKYSRITDVIDVWYDSGAMPFARLHYPFENKDKFEEKFPAEFIAEGIDQTRGWFYSLHAVATTLFDSNAYNNVIINGTITDEKGQKLSKSKGNYTPPIDVIESVGADTVRLNFFSSPLMYGEDTAVTDKTLKSTKQETILPLWNIYTYLTTYANMHDWQPNTELAYNERNVTDDTHPWDHIPFDDIENNLDAWILLKLQNTISEVTENMEVYQVPRAIKAIKDLISETSKWYIRSNRTRFADGDTRALEVLYYVLIETCKLAAPFIPFTTEHIYRQLVPEHLEGQLESVHLTDYPEIDNAFVKQYSQIENEMNILRKIIEQGHNLRVENGLKVRQPLSTLFVHTTNKDVGALTDWMIELISSELNVREVREVIEIPEDKTIVQASEPTLGLAIGLNTEISDELKKEGSLRELTRQIQSIRKNQKLNMGDSITLEYSTDQDMIEKLFNDMKDELMRSVKAKTITKLDSISDGMVIKLDDGEVTISVKPV
jgi:isoleucyl-tRNA synthetase